MVAMRVFTPDAIDTSVIANATAPITATGTSPRRALQTVVPGISPCMRLARGRPCEPPLSPRRI